MLEDSLREGKSAIIVGSCEVNYTGRASSILPEGERIVIIKPDGTVLVHQEKNRKPVNWNPPGCDANVKLENGELHLISKRTNPEETLLVNFKNVKTASSFELIDNEELQLVGTEEDLVESVLQNPNLFEKGFKPKKKEMPTSTGSIDIYGEDSEGNGVALEFKRDKATLSAVWQLSRYVEELEKKRQEKIRGVVASPRITSGAHKLLDKIGLEYKKIEKLPSTVSEDVIYDKSQRKIKEFGEDKKKNEEQ